MNIIEALELPRGTKLYAGCKYSKELLGGKFDFFIIGENAGGKLDLFLAAASDRGKRHYPITGMVSLKHLTEMELFTEEQDVKLEQLARDIANEVWEEMLIYGARSIYSKAILVVKKHCKGKLKD